eukprot:scaffold60855_cov36-Phaeocystis_antarctica.AAC.1
MPSCRPRSRRRPAPPFGSGRSTPLVDIARGEGAPALPRLPASQPLPLVHIAAGVHHRPAPLRLALRVALPLAGQLALGRDLEAVGALRNHGSLQHALAQLVNRVGRGVPFGLDHRHQMELHLRATCALTA